ncbi:MAG: 3-methyl-2-oxobutanoate dehydrogenase subunit beta [Thermofilaceae archaeon]
MVTVKQLLREEYWLPGHAACPGCPASLGLRMLGKALEGRFVLVVPAGCTTVIQGMYPKTPSRVPLLNIAFAASAAAATGLKAALELRGIDVPVVVWAGDGGTVDIGLQALSGAAERNEDILYICYDNEAYQNTGIQRSGATPPGAWTTTTPLGKRERRKVAPLIVAAHRVPYVATASIAYPLDFVEKVRKAVSKRGFKYIHLHAPCPTGWRFPPSETVEIGRLAVETGAWVLYEIEDGVLRLTGRSASLLDPARRKPLEEYLRRQGRFAHLFRPENEQLLELLKMDVQENWESIRSALERGGRIF